MCAQAHIEAMARIDRDRLTAALGVAVLHVLIGYAFLTGLALEVVREAGRSLKVFAITEPLPPPPFEQPRPVAKAAPEEEGAAAPPNLKARPTPVVAPPPEVKLPVPTPVVTAPQATPLPPGPDASAGASDRAGPGWGAGGQGMGTGSGSAGSGTGGGGGGRQAQHVRGALRNSDYPRTALRMGIEGSVTVRYTVRADGQVERCTILRSSGYSELDLTTCRLIERRFRYRPALDADGRPIAQDRVRTYDWWLPSKRLGATRP